MEQKHFLAHKGQRHCVAHREQKLCPACRGQKHYLPDREKGIVGSAQVVVMEEEGILGGHQTRSIVKWIDCDVKTLADRWSFASYHGA